MRPHAQVVEAARGVQAREDVGPDVDVLALQPPHAMPVVVVEPREVAIVHADDVGARQGEIDVEIDEIAQAVRGIRRGLDHATAARQQLFARAHEDRAEQRALAGEVTVNGGAADPHRGAEVFEAHPVEAFRGEQPRGLAQQIVLAPGLGAAAAAEGRRIGVGLGGAHCHIS